MLVALRQAPLSASSARSLRASFIYRVPLHTLTHRIMAPSPPSSTSSVSSANSSTKTSSMLTAAAAAAGTTETKHHHHHPTGDVSSDIPAKTKGTHIVYRKFRNYDVAYPLAQRDALGIRGLIPPVEQSLELQTQRCMQRIRGMAGSGLEKHEYLANLRQSNAHLFYRLLMDFGRELVPLVYTPVVGEACQRWSHIYTRPEGLYIGLQDLGRVRSILDNYPSPAVDICVVTDGSRILGLGDLGVNGMGIPIGKLSLYVACAGIHPEATLPIVLDCGTNNDANLADPFYLGLRERRCEPAREKALVEEFVQAARAKWPGIVIQFEDFSTDMAFDLLETYQPRASCFNDDIQGTGAVILAGFINAIRLSGTPMADHRFVFFGAGSAGVGVAKMLCEWIVKQGVDAQRARSMFWLVDSKGLVTTTRGDALPAHKQLFARAEEGLPPAAAVTSLADVVSFVRPTGLLGLSTVGASFTEPIVRMMAAQNARPIIFPLSNPVSKSECTFRDAVEWTDGKCLFASGSPFEPTEYGGRQMVPGQGNNMYIFPGLGLGAILAKASRITDEMVHATAETLSVALDEQERALGMLYPDIGRIRSVSAVVARGVIRKAQAQGVDENKALRALSDAELDAHIAEYMYDPRGPTQ